MSTKDIKELAKIATNQYRDKMISMIKNCGTINTNIKTYRLFENDFGIPSYENCIVTKIENGNVYYSDNVYDELEVLTMDELFNIAINI